MCLKSNSSAGTVGWNSLCNWPQWMVKMLVWPQYETFRKCLSTLLSKYFVSWPTRNKNLRLTIYKHRNRLKMACLRLSWKVVLFLLMSIEVGKWIPLFSRHVRFHGNRENLFLAYFDFFQRKKAVFTLPLRKDPCQKTKWWLFFIKDKLSTVFCYWKNSSNRFCQAARDFDMYLVKRYLLIIQQNPNV